MVCGEEEGHYNSYNISKKGAESWEGGGGGGGHGSERDKGYTTNYSPLCWLHSATFC